MRFCDLEIGERFFFPEDKKERHYRVVYKSDSIMHFAGSEAVFIIPKDYEPSWKAKVIKV